MQSDFKSFALCSIHFYTRFLHSQLVITSRGIHALTSLSADLAERVMRVTTRVDGRTLHQPDGSCVYQVRPRARL